MRVYTAGTFDLFHAGHVRFLSRCARLGDDLVVALNTDEFIRRYKGAPPTIPYEARRSLLASCRWVDEVVAQDSECLAEQLEFYCPGYLAVGSDWARRDYYAQIGVDQDWLDRHDISLIYIPYTRGVSSTQIRKQIEAGV